MHPPISPTDVHSRTAAPATCLSTRTTELANTHACTVCCPSHLRSVLRVHCVVLLYSPQVRSPTCLSPIADDPASSFPEKNLGILLYYRAAIFSFAFSLVLFFFVCLFIWILQLEILSKNYEIFLVSLPMYTELQ